MPISANCIGLLLVCLSIGLAICQPFHPSPPDNYWAITENWQGNDPGNGFWFETTWCHYGENTFNQRVDAYNPLHGSQTLGLALNGTSYFTSSNSDHCEIVPDPNHKVQSPWWWLPHSHHTGYDSHHHCQIFHYDWVGVATMVTCLATAERPTWFNVTSMAGPDHSHIFAVFKEFMASHPTAGVFRLPASCHKTPAAAQSSDEVHDSAFNKRVLDSYFSKTTTAEKPSIWTILRSSSFKHRSN